MLDSYRHSEPGALDHFQSIVTAEITLVCKDYAAQHEQLCKDLQQLSRVVNERERKADADASKVVADMESQRHALQSAMRALDEQVASQLAQSCLKQTSEHADLSLQITRQAEEMSEKMRQLEHTWSAKAAEQHAWATRQLTECGERMMSMSKQEVADDGAKQNSQAEAFRLSERLDVLQKRQEQLEERLNEELPLMARDAKVQREETLKMFEDVDGKLADLWSDMTQVCKAQNAFQLQCGHALLNAQKEKVKSRSPKPEAAKPAPKEKLTGPPLPTFSVKDLLHSASQGLSIGEDAEVRGGSLISSAGPIACSPAGGELTRSARHVSFDECVDMKVIEPRQAQDVVLQHMSSPRLLTADPPVPLFQPPACQGC